MRSIVGPLLVVALALLVPVLPFLLLGETFEARVAGWFDTHLPPQRLATLIVAVLSADLILPVPSSFVSTLGGMRLGIMGGTVASWVGMTLGAVIGFALTRRFGPALALRMTGTDDYARLERLAARHGPVLLALTRALPLLAEATVLLMGASQLAWRRFLPPVLLANLGIALVYSAFGRFSYAHDAIPLALSASAGVPILAAAIARWWLPLPPKNDATAASPDA